MRTDTISIEEVVKLNSLGYTQKETAKRLGCVYQDIQQLLKQKEIYFTRRTPR